jgi:hypothetical protein
MTDDPITVLRSTFERDGADTAVEVAKEMIQTATAWIAQEKGVEEALRVLQTVVAAQAHRSALI